MRYSLDQSGRQTCHNNCQKHLFLLLGEPTYQWQFHKVPLNASKPFQVVFEVRKGNKESSGGFSIDDINLSESECPHYVWQINNFERILTSSDKSYLYSPRGYSAGGYSYQIVIALRKTYFGVYFRLVSDDSDSTLEWPCPWRQVTVIMLDKNPHIQKQMSKQISLSTDPSFCESIKEPQCSTVMIMLMCQYNLLQYGHH